MTEFFHSQAFAFILGCFVGGVIGFLGAVICAASGQASRMEERISDEAIYEAGERERKRRGEDSSLDDQFIKLDGQFIKLLEEAKRLGVGEKEFIDKASKRYKRVPEPEIASQNNPRTD